MPLTFHVAGRFKVEPNTRVYVAFIAMIGENFVLSFSVHSKKIINHTCARYRTNMRNKGKVFTLSALLILALKIAL